MSWDLFERYAGEYDRWFDDHREEYEAELVRIRSIMPAPDPCAVEVGVGSGRFASALGISIGIEPSMSLGLMARSRGIEVIRGCVESLPLRGDSCPSVLMVTVICFLEDPARALKEIFRILIPGGRLLIGFIDRDGQIARKYLHEPGKHRFLSKALFYSNDKVMALLSNSGFQVMSVDSIAGFSVMAAEKPSGI